ncbi:transformer-2 protein homolog alpha-like [Patiria miniata]|uniref:RRM domain-containing protein n=1 Tax=Patiria miniata TaxID=46514 RepID=A0A913Z140_PATMI|nr:transformer-2 protein homolog alpha-like [Patiria miniata]
MSDKVEEKKRRSKHKRSRHTRSRSRSRSRSPALSDHTRSRSRSRGHYRSRSRSSSYSRSPRRSNRSRSRSRDRYNRRSYSRSPIRGYRSRSRDRYRGRSYRDRSPRRSYRRERSTSPLSDRRRHVGSRENPTENDCIGVFGLSLYTTETDLREVYTVYGPLDRCEVVYDHKTGRSRGFAFVTFHNVEDARDAKVRTDGMEIDGRRIRVDFSITKRAHTPTPGIYMGQPTFPEKRRDFRDLSPYRSRGRSFSRSRSRSAHRSRKKSWTRSRSRSRS